MTVALSTDKYNTRKHILFGPLDRAEENRFLNYFCQMKESEPASETSNKLSKPDKMEKYKVNIFNTTVGVRVDGSGVESCIRDFEK
jgi:hypothetical protein